MSRLTRINTIWRKELIDTLRDRRTLIAMVLVPMALYPAMILGSLQGFELQISRLKQEEYKVVVAAAKSATGESATSSEAAALWVRSIIDTDPTRRPGVEGMPAEEVVKHAERGDLPAEPTTTQPTGDRSARERAQADVRRQPPKYKVVRVDSRDAIVSMISSGEAHVGVLVDGPLPSAEGQTSARLTLFMDQTDIRSQIASAGVEAILARAGDDLLQRRLSREKLDVAFLRPIDVIEQPTATPEKVGGSIMGQIVPLILIIMTITGAIYPAIDLTAGERERGTLETLMVAPVPTVDLIAGKFVVVALIGMLSAGLNLLSIGGTIYLGGLGELLTQGSAVVIPLRSLPWVLLLLIPLAVMFSAVLLAVCSFARSFKEAQNYVMPVMVAAMIPAVVGILPGTRLEGPMLIVPVTNITILTRDLFMGRWDPTAIVWVTASTTLYAGAAVAIAARLFGQEAVLFADSGSIKTLFQRRFFKPSDRPSAAQAFLLLAVTFSLNFFAQSALTRAWQRAPDMGPIEYFGAVAAIIVALFLLLPIGAAGYLRVRVPTAFGLSTPPPMGIVAALCLGVSTWVLVNAYLAFQQTWLPMPPPTDDLDRLESSLRLLPIGLAVFLLAVAPAICEEFLFRGFALSGLKSGMGPAAAIIVTALAFGLHHHSVHRLIVTSSLGAAFALLVIAFRSIWPAVLAHAMHNSLAMLAVREDGLRPWLRSIGLTVSEDGTVPEAWLAAAAGLTLLGVLIAVATLRRNAAPAAERPLIASDLATPGT